MVAKTNQAYADSAVIQRVRLVARELVGYSEASSGSRDLARLGDRNDGHMDGVHGIRDRTGADLVHLIVDRDHGGNFDVCGKAYTPSVRLTGDFERYGFGLTDYRCSGGTFPHELGHNMSLAHDRYVVEHKSSVVYPYGFGYVNQRAFASGAPESTRWRTIMAYGSQCVDAGFSCGRILRFSNPNQTYAGDRLGVPGDHRDDSVTGPSDARRALNNTRRTVANFRPTRFRCSFTLRPAYHYVLDTGGGPFEFEVVANSSRCSWNASTNDGFLRATQASGTGNGVVRYHVEEHTGAATRVGTITVGNATFTVTQFVGLTQPRTLTSASAQLGHAGSPAANGMALPPVVRGSVASIAASETADIAGLRRWDAWVDAMARTDALVLRGHRADRQVPGRTHESFTQYHLGVPVHGGGVSRQLDRGVTVSIFGTVHRSIDVETIPSISAEEAAAHLETETGTSLVLGQLPLLVVFPLPDGSYAPDLAGNPEQRPDLFRERAHRPHRVRRHRGAGAERGRERRRDPRSSKESQRYARRRDVSGTRQTPAGGDHDARRAPRWATAGAPAGTRSWRGALGQRRRGERRRQYVGRPGGRRRSCPRGWDLRLLRSGARLRRHRR